MTKLRLPRMQQAQAVLRGIPTLGTARVALKHRGSLRPPSAITSPTRVSKITY
jgi:hypothetical protein